MAHSLLLFIYSIFFYFFLDDEMVQAFILCEILARIVKNEIRALLRETMKAIRKPMEARLIFYYYHYYHIVVFVVMIYGIFLF